MLTRGTGWKFYSFKVGQNVDLVINKSNMSGLNEDCEGVNDTYQQDSLTIRGSVAFTSCLTCLIALILMACFQLFYNTRQPTMRTQRLIIYLTLSALFHSVCLIFETMSYKKDVEYSLLNNSCTASTIFLMQYSSWVELLFTLVITVHVVLIAFDIYCKRNETVYILFPLIFPLMFSWIAFVHDIYGIYGAWCWIQKDYLKCSSIPRGLIKQFILWHGPQCLILLSTFVLIVIFFGRLIRRYVQTSQCKAILQQTIALVVFSITYQVFSWLGFVNNIYRAAAQKEQKELWYFHAVVSPAWDLFVGIGATTYTAVLMKTTKRNHYTRFAVNDQDKSCEVDF